MQWVDLAAQLGLEMPFFMPCAPRDLPAPLLCLSQGFSTHCSAAELKNKKRHILITDIILKNEMASQHEKCLRGLIYNTAQTLSNVLPAPEAAKTASMGLPAHSWAPFFPSLNVKTKIQMASSSSLPMTATFRNKGNQNAALICYKSLTKQNA